MAVEIVMPSPGMYTIEGEVTRWLVPHGAPVEAGQPVLELTTEKATIEITAPAAGILSHARSAGERVQVQGLLGHVLAPGETPPAPPSTPVPAPGPAAAPPAPAMPAPGAPSPPAAIPLRVTPVARRRAADLGVDLAGVAGSGPNGRITEADVLAAAGVGDHGEVAAGTVATASPRVVRRVPLTGMRGLIARRMQQSLATTAQVTLTRELDAGPLVQARQALPRSATDRAAGPAPVSYDVLLARALAAALEAQPALNAVVEEDTILVLADVHVGVAVAVADGLVVPVLRAPARRPVLELADELDRLVRRAREGRLRPEDMDGGTVTLTNLGAQHVDVFTPILNPPQSVILGVGRIAPRPFVDASGQLTVRPTVHLSLTFDHRVADGVEGAALLDRIAAQLAQPADPSGG